MQSRDRDSKKDLKEKLKNQNLVLFERATHSHLASLKKFENDKKESTHASYR